MPKVLIADKLAPQGMEILRAAADIEIDQAVGLKPAELAAKIEPYHGLIVRSGSTVTAEVVAAARNLKVIGRAGIGVDNIDVEAATKKGIVVMNTPAGNNVITAEHGISMMLSLARSIPQATASMKAGKWEKGRFTGSEVFNKTLGIVGIGNIGSLVAERALGLKMRVIAFDPFISQEAAQRLGVELVSLDDLYARADFISVHTPLTKETRGLIGTAAFAKMKKGVRVINCARGGIVDEEALAAAITEGKVAGAALDVFVEEPPPADHPLLKLDQVICTPHLGAATDEAQVNVAIAIAQQVVNYLSRGVIQDAVNVPSISPELLEILGPYLSLCEKLGSLQGQMLTAAPQELLIEYAGEVAAYDVKSLTLAVLRGLLTRALDSAAINYVNAPSIARERGIRIIESKTSQPKGFANLITVTASTASVPNVVAGAVFGQRVIRLVRINKFFLDADPQGHILMLLNRDVPGVVGSVGTLLGEAKINIARLELGREGIGGNAVSLVHVDDAIPDAVMERLRKQPNIVSAQQITL
ncbi:MAG: phosphoglycerate dehydrogenase [Deltaproteobacteria bacterium]|nr:phosphoglycerate dehydrogenase [Deltaproteobacteria bacterium]